MRRQVRLARPLVYVAAGITAGAILLVSASDHPHSFSAAAIETRQLFGLWALALLLASVIIGPLVAVVPWLPLKPHLVYARRAAGICAFAFAVMHVLCYLPSPIRRGWHELYTPGVLWISGLALGLLALSDMTALALTSTDAAVTRLGGRRWKRLHRTVYVLALITWAHALCLGADFGLNHAPDVSGAPDAGALIGFTIASLCWITLFALRARGIRWTRLRPTRPAVSN